MAMRQENDVLATMTSDFWHVAYSCLARHRGLPTGCPGRDSRHFATTQSHRSASCSTKGASVSCAAPAGRLGLIGGCRKGALRNRLSAVRRAPGAGTFGGAGIAGASLARRPQRRADPRESMAREDAVPASVPPCLVAPCRRVADTPDDDAQPTVSPMALFAEVWCRTTSPNASRGALSVMLDAGHFTLDTISSTSVRWSGWWESGE